MSSPASALRYSYCSLNLPFEFPFTISGGRTKTHQPSLLLRLHFQSITGYGEAPSITYYNIPVEKMIADFEAARASLESFSFLDSAGNPQSPKVFWDFCFALFPSNSFLLAALDIAYWDLYGKYLKKPLYALFHLQFSSDFLCTYYPSLVAPLSAGLWPSSTIPCDYTIGISPSTQEMVDKMKSKPWPIYKIKVGLPDDIDRLKALRATTQAPFRVDANAGWKLDEALEKMKAMKELGVEFIEQPLDKAAWEDQRTLHSQSSLPLIADESCVSEHDVARCAGVFHGINIKLTKCGGITPALRMIENGKRSGLSLMMGCMNECSVGCAAIANFIPFLDYVDMDGPLLLKEDVATGINYDFGNVSMSGNPGLGITVKPEWS